jgi:protein SCO1/2
VKHVLIALSALLAVSVIACGKPQKPVNVAGEKVYDMRGKIVSRDRGDNSLKIDHEEIKGFMEAMTMDYTVRGAKVETLPADGTKIHAKLHVADDAYWVSDVQKTP